MNLENINLKEVFEGVVNLATEAHMASLSLDCARIQSVIQTAHAIFQSSFKVRIGSQWYSELSLARVIEAKDNYDVLELSFGGSDNDSRFTYAFDEEFGYWMCLFRPKTHAQDTVMNLILTKRLASQLAYELNFGSFKTVELANNLRKA